MPDSPVKNFHRSCSVPSRLSLQDPPQVAVEINKSPCRSASPPVLRDRICRLFLHQDHSSGSCSEPSSTSGPCLVMMAAWMRIKTKVPKILYENMLAILFTWLLAGFIILPVTFGSIRNSRALDGIRRAGKAVFSVVQNVPLLVVAGTCCGVVGLSWLCWENRDHYIWLPDCAFL